MNILTLTLIMNISIYIFCIVYHVALTIILRQNIYDYFTHNRHHRLLPLDKNYTLSNNNKRNVVQFETNICTVWMAQRYKTLSPNQYMIQFTPKVIIDVDKIRQFKFVLDVTTFLDEETGIIFYSIPYQQIPDTVIDSFVDELTDYLNSLQTSNEQ